MHQGVREKLVSALATVSILSLLGYLLLVGLNVSRPLRADTALTLIVLAPLRPPLERPKREVRRPKAGGRSSTPSPRNIRSAATPLVALPAIVPLPAPTIVTAPVAGAGAQRSTGASDRAGPGQGAGGEGNGLGEGYGDGDGGGDTPPRLIRGRIKFADMSDRMRDSGVTGTVSVRYRVGVDGRASDCIIIRSSGNRELDGLTCRLIEERFRFRPSRDADGRPVRSLIEENHSWIVDRGDEDDAGGN